MLAGLALAQRGRPGPRGRTTDRSEEISAGAAEPAGDAGEEGDDDQVRDGQRAEGAAIASEA